METQVDLAALAGWMDGQGLGAGPIENATLLGGGTQNILLRFSRAGRTYVLRRPPPHLRANSNDTMRREARMLGALKGTDVPHPGLIAACAAEDVIGAAFYLMEPIDGFNPSTGLPPLHAGSPAIRHRMGLALVEGIAALGALDYKALGLSDFGKVDNYLERQVARWKAQLDEVQRRCDAATAKKKRKRSTDCRPGRLQNIDNSIEALNAAAAMQQKAAK